MDEVKVPGKVSGERKDRGWKWGVGGGGLVVCVGRPGARPRGVQREVWTGAGTGVASEARQGRGFRGPPPSLSAGAWRPTATKARARSVPGLSAPVRYRRRRRGDLTARVDDALEESSVGLFPDPHWKRGCGRRGPKQRT